MGGDAKEAEEVDCGGNEGDDGGGFSRGDDMERGGVADLLAPAGEEEVGDREEEAEKDGVGEIEREEGLCLRIGGRVFQLLGFEAVAGGRDSGSTANVHFPTRTDLRNADAGNEGKWKTQKLERERKKGV